MKKILISSDCNGRLDLLLPKIHELHNKNNFNFLLLVGSVCPSTSSHIFHKIKTGVLQFPLPTYFIDNSNMSLVFSEVHPEGSEIVKNLYYLGNCGYKQVQGIKIAFISGNSINIQHYSQHSDTIYKFSRDSAKKLIQQNSDKQIDILLTNQWAQQYKPMQDTKPSQNQIISQICYELSPRYHVASGGVKYLRLPAFKGRKGNPTHFINVAEIKQLLPKDKYLVAIQMNPSSPEVLENMTDNPLVKNVDWNVVEDQGEKPRLTLKQQIKLRNNKTQPKQQKVLDKTSFILFEGFPEQTPNSQITQFLQKWGQVKQIEVFKKLKGGKKCGIVRFVNLQDAEICLKDSGKYTMYQSRIKFQIKQQNQKYRLKQCFLCMDNTQKFDKSLLVHKSKFTYISIDKGPVSDYHFQIVPINHVNSTGELQHEQQQQMAQMKSIFQNYFTAKNYTFVCFQRYMSLSAEINHAILHCVPLLMSQNQVLAKFRKVNQQGRFGFHILGAENRNQNQDRNNSPYYILFQINGYKYIKHVDRKDKKFEQGRQIICEMIEKPERLNWRDCEISNQKIKQTVEQLQKALT